MNSDQADVQELIASIKAERQAQKDKEARESWTKYVSLTLVCLAVLTAIATLKGGGFTTRTLKELNEATFQQAHASDQWSFFQAKSIKQNLYEIEGDLMPKDADAKAIEKVKAKVEKYGKEKDEIMRDAKAHEVKRDAARANAAKVAELSKDMGMAITFFQISVALGGICLITKKKWLWFGALSVGGYAAFKMFTVLSTPF
ncbi:MAG: hypothetical protein RL514_1259 [Verrucomicrobiota bacterium]|jgi:ABC-type multidrug transport system fused ATPase/permease subunit